MTTAARDEPGERIRTAFELYEFAELMLRQRLLRESPEITEDEVDLRVGEWLSERPGAEQGDALGRPGSWPRRP